MSESDGTSAWVGDLGRVVCCDYSDDDYDDDGNDDFIAQLNKAAAQRELLEIEFAEIGELRLLAGKSISPSQLHKNGISPSVLRHALHQSEMTIGFSSSLPKNSGEYTDSPVMRFVKGMLDLGRPYAIARYARWEQLDYPSTLTATLPYGIRALVNQLLASECITRTREVDACIRTALEPIKNGEMTAYRRTGLLQAALHRIADDAPAHPGGTELNRNRMRAMLALTRLYFSIIELRLASIDELRSLLSIYEAERAIAVQDDARVTANGKVIRAWSLRHIQPLLNLYPYSIRNGLRRALIHGQTAIERTALVNELALAHCGIFRMRATRKDRTLPRAQ
jgi:hypothetical protein